MGKIRILSSKLKNINTKDKVTSYFGKKVLSKSGEYVGKVYDVILQKGSIIGYLVSGKVRIFIGKESIASQSEKTIMLKIEPVTNIIGKKVFDAAGKKIGSVFDLKRKSTANTYTDLKVRQAIYKKSFLIPKKEVRVSKKNVILDKVYE